MTGDGDGNAFRSDIDDVRRRYHNRSSDWRLEIDSKVDDGDVDKRNNSSSLIIQALVSTFKSPL
jgi:hypothetical protein